MAILKKLPPFLGTKDGICIYMMRGKFVMRAASSLTGKRVNNDPAFSETRKHSRIMARASKISSMVYKQVTGKHKNHGLYNLMTGKASKMLREGAEESEIVRLLSECYV